MEDKLIEKTEEKIKEILDSDINSNNIDHLYKLTKIKHMVKEDLNRYGNYSGYGGRDMRYNRGNDYGNSYGEYGRRGRYRGDSELDRMSGEYGRYQESRNRYGAGEDTDKSFHYMVKALEDFIMVLKEEADTPQQKQQLMQSLQNCMM